MKSQRIKFGIVFLIIVIAIGFGLRQFMSKNLFVLGNIGAKTGVVLQKIEIKGNIYTKDQQIQDIADLTMGKPLLTMDLSYIKERVSTLDWIRSVLVCRKIPNQLSIVVWEYKPFALWSFRNKAHIIDETGHVITTQAKFKSYHKLPIIKGRSANLHAKCILNAVKKHPHIYKHVKYMRFIEGRRWDIITNDVIIKLPEKKINQALSKFNKLKKANKLTHVAMVDLRLQDKTLFHLQKGRRV